MNLDEAKDLIQQNYGKFYTYLLKRPSGEPFYVGKGNCKGFRIEHHVKEAIKSKNNSYKLNIIRKIICSGERLDYEIIDFFDDESDAFQSEVENIAKYGRKDNGTGILANLTDGGEGTSNPSEETRKKIKQRKIWNKGLKLGPLPEETRKKMSDANKGKERSEEHKRKLSEANKGQIPWNKGKADVYSEEIKKKRSEALKGKNKCRTPWNKGKADVYSDETRMKMSEAQKRRFHNNGVSSKTRRKISESARNISDETRKKMSIASSNRSEESKKKTSETMKKIWKEKIEQGYSRPDSTRLKISIIVKQRFKNEEERKRQSDNQRGKHHSEETKMKMSKIHKGRIHTEECKRKLSESLMGHNVSEETKFKLREAWKIRKERMKQQKEATA